MRSVVVWIFALSSLVAQAQEPGGPNECDPVLGMALVEVEQRTWGVEIRLIAKDPANVPILQEYAEQTFGRCPSVLRSASPEDPATEQ